jgi:hypothetical protein
MLTAVVGYLQAPMHRHLPPTPIAELAQVDFTAAELGCVAVTCTPEGSM